MNDMEILNIKKITGLRMGERNNIGRYFDIVK